MRSRAIIAASVLGGALVSGGWLMQRGLRSTGTSAYERAQLFDEVMTRVERFYVDTISDADLYQKAVDGMLQQLHDPHSVFLTPARLASLEENTSGRYGGVGIQIDVRDGWITVVAPLPGTPAQEAGIQSGDRIVAIEGQTTKDWTSDEALKALRGNPGTTVHVMVERAGVETPMPFSLTRREIHYHPVQHALMLGNGIGYVDLTIFSEDAAADLRNAVDSLRKQGMRTLVLDLRGDPGGLLDQGVEVSDLFLDPGQRVVSMKGRTSDSNRDYVDRNPQPWPGLLVEALVDSGTASAAEILSGALQDHDRAVILGTTTYGKGSAQSLFPMPNGGALKLTTALWYTPSGRSINKPHEPSGDAQADDGDGDSTATKKPQPRYRTDAGRTVLGGGGITPDVFVVDSLVSRQEQTLQTALGKQVPKFFDALTEYALALKGSHSLASQSFTVTPAMREQLWQRMQQHGVKMDRAAFEKAAPLVDRLLSYQLERYVFGERAEFQRRTRDDAVIRAAIDLATGATSEQQLLQKAQQSGASATKSGK